MATLAEAIRIYKYNLSTGMLIGLNNVLKQYQNSNYKFMFINVFRIYET